MQLRRDGEPFSLASLGLFHNGFSQRAWLQPGKDLYKGNGRVKHEQHCVHIGPFLNLHAHSYQSKDDHAVCSQADDEPGGNNHFEILVFRNAKMIGGAPFERLRLKDIPLGSALSEERLYITQIKERAIEEWLGAIHAGKTGDAGLLSPFSDHRLCVALMSAIYESYANAARGGQPVCAVPWRSA
jgi:hypothetical protein